MRFEKRALLIVAMAALTCALPAVAGDDLIHILPSDGVEGWVLRETPRSFHAETLYEYIDGNADLFLSYGFQEVVVGDYIAVGGNEGLVTVDVYDMGASLHAFGVYRSEKPLDVRAYPIGAEGYRTGNLLAFWQGGCYVKIATVEGENSEAPGRLAEVVAKKIVGQTALPDELKLLPVEDRVPGSERYFKQSALGHRFLDEVIGAQYRAKRGVAYLYLGNLGEIEKAEAALEALREFEREAKVEPSELSGIGEDAFAVRDRYFGETIVARLGQFVVLAMSESWSPEDLHGLVAATIGQLPDERENEC